MKKFKSFLSLLWAVANLFVTRWKQKPPCCPCPYPAASSYPPLDFSDRWRSEESTDKTQ